MVVWEKSSTFAVPNEIRIMLFASQLHDLKMLLPWVRVRHEQLTMRAIIEQQRRVMTPEQVKEQSALIIARLEQMSSFQNAKTVLLYYPIHNEVDLRPLLEKYAGQKTFLFPVTHRRSLTIHPYDGEEMMGKGRFGVPEPQTAEYKGKIDVILVPGVVFDQHCNRIGRGGGYYDKFLSKQSSAKKVGVCYSFQLKKHSIPHHVWDVKMDRVVTPQLTIEL